MTAHAPELLGRTALVRRIPCAVGQRVTAPMYRSRAATIVASSDFVMFMQPMKARAAGTLRPFRAEFFCNPR